MSGGPRPLVREADRERLLALLREHYSLGRLGDDELDRRVGVVLKARYVDEAASAVSDLPPLHRAASSAPYRTRTRRGHAEAAVPAAGWIPTDERFRDPTTRALVRVWVDPADHSRHYVPEPED
jgi:hypothetical protein